MHITHYRCIKIFIFYFYFKVYIKKEEMDDHWQFQVFNCSKNKQHLMLS